MKIVGHRGAKGLAPENTVASLLKAIEHNVDEIEFDLRVTKDNKVVLHHDPEITDASGNSFKIETTTLAELSKHKSDLALFDEALKAINHRVTILVEVKPHVAIKPVVAAIKGALSSGWEPNEIVIGSFSQKTLRALHTDLPELQTVVIERWSGVRARFRARQVNAKRLNMNQRWLWWGFIRAVKRGGYELYPYTMNDSAKAYQWDKYGIAGVITDYPDRFEK